MEFPVTYILDKNNRIVSVRCGDGSKALPEYFQTIIGQSIWSFFKGVEVEIKACWSFRSNERHGKCAASFLQEFGRYLWETLLLSFRHLQVARKGGHTLARLHP